MSHAGLLADDAPRHRLSTADVPEGDILIPASQIKPFLTSLENAMKVVNAGAAALPWGTPGAIQVNSGLISANANIASIRSITG